jgi:hypothetical protein
MILKDLSHDGKLALVALTELVMISDRDITDTEVAQVDEIVECIGEETFQKLAEEAEQRFAERTTLRTFLKTIVDQDARELIYGTVLAESLADNVPHEKAAFLEWLAQEWKVPVQVEGTTNA